MLIGHHYLVERSILQYPPVVQGHQHFHIYYGPPISHCVVWWLTGWYRYPWPVYKDAASPVGCKVIRLFLGAASYAQSPSTIEYNSYYSIFRVHKAGALLIYQYHERRNFIIFGTAIDANRAGIKVVYPYMFAAVVFPTPCTSHLVSRFAVWAL